MKLYGYEIRKGQAEDGRGYSYKHVKIIISHDRAKAYEAAENYVWRKELEHKAQDKWQWYDYEILAVNVEEA